MKTKKSTLLSLATAAAIVATTFGTYAVWDTLTSETSQTVSIAKPSVTVNATSTTLVENDSVGANTVDYSTTATFNITGADKLSSLKLTPTVTMTEGISVTEGTDYDVEITQTNDTITDGVDSKLDEGANVYDVKVTVKNKDLQGKEMKVTVEGVATPKSAN